MHTCLCWDTDGTIRGQHYKRTVLFLHNSSHLAWFQIVHLGNKCLNLLKHLVSLWFVSFLPNVIYKEGRLILVNCLHLTSDTLPTSASWNRVIKDVCFGVVTLLFSFLLFYVSVMLFTHLYMCFFSLCAWFILRF